MDRLDEAVGQALVCALAREIFHVAFINGDTRERLARVRERGRRRPSRDSARASQDGRDLLRNMCDVRLDLLSQLLVWVDQQALQVGKMGLYLFQGGCSERALVLARRRSCSAQSCPWSLGRSRRRTLRSCGAGCWRATA
jgi:hypothetical protein